MTRSSSFGIVAALSLVLVSTACTAPDHARDEQDLRQWVKAQTEAWNAHDAAAWTRDFADDADFINIVGTVFQGRAEIETRHAAIFASIFKTSHAKVTVRKIRFPSEDIAVVDTLHEVTGHTGLPPGVQNTEEGLLRTQMRYVLKRTQKQWRIVSGQNTDVKPVPKPVP
ncbi:SgcJ/EcaC family oxidoreductase [Corallococcus sp. AB030]|uniref:SgcJ/EcaC family oxidoreductase n=1 Tax=unclassified Corallococcus TaxID=2685029 RepID=UPI000EA37802|nr:MULTISPECIES: SgcJ/EcaC family oxidoreductase [unclassified Corallococcus]RKH29952.1 SgcJ/EcaC family oxidoreductase [Corallococcus sp. CA041A]RKI17083.1 SgcJ/EcaC family oxidoreductase [Corallococcus sp. AB030]